MQCGEKVFLLNIFYTNHRRAHRQFYICRHSQAHRFHTQLFELCITDFTKSCHLYRAHRIFLLLQSVWVCNFFTKNLKHVVTTSPAIALRVCFFSFCCCMQKKQIPSHAKPNDENEATNEYYHVINTQRLMVFNWKLLNRRLRYGKFF